MAIEGTACWAVQSRAEALGFVANDVDEFLLQRGERGQVEEHRRDIGVVFRLALCAARKLGERLGSLRDLVAQAVPANDLNVGVVEDFLDVGG